MICIALTSRSLKPVLQPIAYRRVFGLFNAVSFGLYPIPLNTQEQEAGRHYPETSMSSATGSGHLHRPSIPC